MAETKTTKTPAKRTPAKKAAPKKTAATAKPAAKTAAKADTGTAEAKSRFNTALEEAKSGAAALRAEAGSRSEDLMGEAKVYGDKAKVKAGELATDGKAAASDAIASIGKVVGDTAETIDERLGEQYGDYARKASRGLAETSAKLEAKSVDELGEDAREFVRKSPGVAVGIAAVAGFLIARMFRGSRD